MINSETTCNIVWHWSYFTMNVRIVCINKSFSDWSLYSIGDEGLTNLTYWWLWICAKLHIIKLLYSLTNCHVDLLSVIIPPLICFVCFVILYVIFVPKMLLFPVGSCVRTCIIFPILQSRLETWNRTYLPHHLFLLLLLCCPPYSRISIADIAFCW